MIKWIPVHLISQNVSACAFRTVHLEQSKVVYRIFNNNSSEELSLEQRAIARIDCQSYWLVEIPYVYQSI